MADLPIWMFGVAIGLLVAIVGMFWFGSLRRRRIEQTSGIAALASMKWRECVGLVLQGLQGEGYREQPGMRQGSESGSNEFVLLRGGEPVLFSYKHGTSYRIGEANVRDFASALQLQGAKSGLLVTLGNAEGYARSMAKRFGIELMDGSQVWPLVQPLMPPNLLAQVRTQSSRQTRLGLQLSAVVGLVIAALSFALGRPDAATNTSAPNPSAQAPAAEAAATERAAPGPARPATAAETAEQQLQAAQQALRELESLTPEQRARNRVDTIAAVSRIPEIRNANWLSESTLVVVLALDMPDDSALVDQVCGLVLRHEEQRYIRLQVEPVPGSDALVRWRTCQ